MNELDLQLNKVARFFSSKFQEFLTNANELDTEFNTFNIPLSDDPSYLSENALERLDSRLSRKFSRDSYTTTSSVPFSDASIPFNNTGQNLISNQLSDDELDETLPSPPPPAAQNNSRRLSHRRRRLSHTLESTSTNPLTRANTISGYDNRGVHIERSLRQHAHAQPPARIMQTIGFQFGRRRGSHVSIHQPDTVAEFNLYYNFRVRCAANYIAFKELKSYVVINRTAFDKILKKWDKVTGSHLRQSYFEKIVKEVDAFSQDNLRTIDQTLAHVLDMYAAVFTMGNKQHALVELKMHLRDHVIFDRSTVWKDLVGKQRQTMDAHVAIPSKGFQIGKFFISYKTCINIFGFLVSLILYIILMCIDTMGQKEASKCLALLIFSALMWAFEVKKLFFSYQKKKKKSHF